MPEHPLAEPENPSSSAYPSEIGESSEDDIGSIIASPRAIPASDNALKYTPANGQVTVRVLDAGSEVRISIEDTGVGI